MGINQFTRKSPKGLAGFLLPVMRGASVPGALLTVAGGKK